MTKHLKIGVYWDNSFKPQLEQRKKLFFSSYRDKVRPSKDIVLQQFPAFYQIPLPVNTKRTDRDCLKILEVKYN